MLVTSIAHNSKFVMFWYFRSMFDVCTQVPELLEIRSTAEPLGLSSPTVRVHASGPVLTEDDQLRWRRVHRSVLRADPGSGNMGRQEEGGRQRLRGGSHASGSFDRSVCSSGYSRWRRLGSVAVTSMVPRRPSTPEASFGARRPSDTPSASFLVS